MKDFHDCPYLSGASFALGKGMGGLAIGSSVSVVRARPTTGGGERAALKRRHRVAHPWSPPDLEDWMGPE